MVTPVGGNFNNNPLINRTLPKSDATPADDLIRCNVVNGIPANQANVPINAGSSPSPPLATGIPPLLTSVFPVSISTIPATPTPTLSSAPVTPLQAVTPVTTPVSSTLSTLAGSLNTIYQSIEQLTNTVGSLIQQISGTNPVTTTPVTATTLPLAPVTTVSNPVTLPVVSSGLTTALPIAPAPLPVTPVPLTPSVGAGAPPAVPAGPVTIVPGADPGTAANVTKQNLIGTNTAPLQNLINQLATDPVGRVELGLAQKNGVQLQYQDTGDPNIYGKYDPTTNTITINPSGPTQLKTLAHELVHAATPGDGDSILEEGEANIVGTQVAARIMGTTAPTPTQTLQLTIPIYQNAGLSNDNTIVQDLANVGIIVPNLTV